MAVTGESIALEIVNNSKRSLDPTTRERLYHDYANDAFRVEHAAVLKVLDESLHEEYTRIFRAGDQKEVDKFYKKNRCLKGAQNALLEFRAQYIPDDPLISRPKRMPWLFMIIWSFIIAAGIAVYWK
jgi:hypothetical protein